MRVLALLACTIVVAFGQTDPALKCVANNVAVPPILRAEGVTELIGDLVLTCTDGTPTAAGQQIRRGNISVTLNSSVTSRILFNGGSEARLLIDEPQSPSNPQTTFIPCLSFQVCNDFGTGGVSSPYANGFNTFQGTQNNANSLTFIGVPIDSPGASGKRVFRITNVRANINQLSTRSSTSPPLQATVIIGDNTVNFNLGTPSPAAPVARSHLFSITPTSLPGNQSQFPNAGPSAVIHVNPHGEIGAFRPWFVGDPQTAFQAYLTDPAVSESGTVIPTLPAPLNKSGQADFGTYFGAFFNGVPDGASIFIPPSIPVNDPTGATVGTLMPIGGRLDANGLTQFVPNQGQITIGFMLTSWNPMVVATKNPLTADIPVWLAYTAPVQPGNVTAFFSYLNNPFTQTTLFTQQFPDACPIPCFSLPDPGIVVKNSDGTIHDSASVAFTVYDPAASQSIRSYASDDRESVHHSDPILVPSTLTAHIVSPGLPVTGVSATKDPSATWLSVALNQNTTPVTATITVDPTMPDGNYSANLTFQSSPILGSVVLPVSYTVDNGVPWFTRYGVKNAASYVNNVISPGELFYIEGNHFGPVTFAGPQLGSDGLVATTIANTQVLFDGQPAPLYYTAAGVVTGFAPFSLDGKRTTNIQVVSNGVASPPVNVFVLDAVPGILTSDSSGGGQGVISNQDGSTNGPGNPELPGNTILLWGTGGGNTNPPGRDGAFSGVGAPVANLKLQVKVFMDGQPATDVSYAGAAPTIVEGVWVIKVRIPANARHQANLPVLVQIGDKTTQPGVTVAVK
jgi:uncharacterized protein (TIGR03437 family)